MSFLRCPNPRCRAEFEDTGEEYPVCPYCGGDVPLDDLEDDYYEPEHDRAGKTKMLLIGAGIGVGALALVGLIVVLLLPSKPEQPQPALSTASLEGPTPEPTADVTPSQTPSAQPEASPTPLPPSPSPTASAREPEPEQTAEPEPSIPPVSAKISAAIETAKKLAEAEEFSRAIGELERALKEAVTLEEKDTINALLRRYQRLASRQFFVQEGERALRAGNFVEAWCFYERARDITPIPLTKAIVERFREAARKIDGSGFDSASKLSFSPIAGGAFEMGSTKGASDEAPLRKVSLTSYWLAQTETTNEQFKLAVAEEVVRAPRRLFAGDSAWTENGIIKHREDHPVVGITWEDAVEFCSWLTDKDHTDYRLPSFMKYTLPTEAMWERAAGGPRGGLYPWSQGTPDRSAVFGKFGLYGVASVKTRMPNEFGLYDMAGNAAEWCSDWYAPYDKTALDNPTGPAEGEHRVIRGGSYLSPLESLRTTARFHLAPHYRVSYVGFRVAAVIADRAKYEEICGPKQ